MGFRQYGAVVTALIMLGLLMGACSVGSGTPPPSPPPQVPVAESLYIHTTSATAVQSAACNVATTFKGSTNGAFVILDFGDATSVGQVSYGLDLNAAAVEFIVEAFAAYYHNCSSTNDPSLILGIGEDNANDFGGNPNGAGSTLADEVNTVNNYLTPLDYVPLVNATGAVDAEPSYGSVPEIQSWAAGFESVGTASWSDFGSADGCPTSGSGTNGPCNNGWKEDDLYQISYGDSGASTPLPEIYATDEANADQWAQIAWYGGNTYSKTELFGGPFTEYQACLQRGGCSGINNSPAAAWSQLWTAVNNIPAISSTAAFDFGYSCDIEWLN